MESTKKILSDEEVGLVTGGLAEKRVDGLASGLADGSATGLADSLAGGLAKGLADGLAKGLADDLAGTPGVDKVEEGKDTLLP